MNTHERRTPPKLRNGASRSSDAGRARFAWTRWCTNPVATPNRRKPRTKILTAAEHTGHGDSKNQIPGCDPTRGAWLAAPVAPASSKHAYHGLDLKEDEDEEDEEERKKERKKEEDGTITKENKAAHKMTIHKISYTASLMTPASEGLPVLSANPR